MHLQTSDLIGYAMSNRNRRFAIARLPICICDMSRNRGKRYGRDGIESIAVPFMTDEIQAVWINHGAFQCSIPTFVWSVRWPIVSAV